MNTYETDQPERITIGAFWRSIEDYYRKETRKYRLVDPETHEEIGPKPKGFDPCSVEEYDWERISEYYEKEALLEMCPGIPPIALSVVEVCELCLCHECQCDEFKLALFKACKLAGAIRN